MFNKNQLSIPSEVKNLQLPIPEYVTFYKDLNRRAFWIEGEIGDLTLEVIRLITQWNLEDKDIEPEKRIPIKFFFFSPGGDLDVNYALIDTIKLSKTPIYGINIGRCSSAAAYIYLACHKRFMLEHACFLFHQGAAEFSGTYGMIQSAMENYAAQVAELTEFMKNHTKYTEEEIANQIVGEWYIDKDEAIKYGVCDKIVDSIGDLF